MLFRSAGFGDDVHIKIKPGERVERVAQSVGGQAVAHEENLRVVLAAVGLQKLNCAASAEIRAADADDDQRVGARADSLRRLDDALKLRLIRI